MSRLRIGVDGYPISGHRAGVGRYTADLLTTVAAGTAELQLDVLAYRLGQRAKQGSAEDLERAGVNIIHRPRAVTRASELLHRVGLPVRYDFLLPGRDAYFFPRFWRPTTGRRPALTIIHDLSCLHVPETAPVAVVSRLLADIRSTVLNSEAIGVVSESVANELVDAFPEAQGRVIVLRPGISPGWGRSGPTRLPSSLPERFLLHVGTLEPRKNLLTLIEAVTLSHGPRGSPLPLVLAGRRGWMDGPIMDAIAAAGPAVRWIPDPSDSLLASLYAGADLSVVASRYEGFGLPLLEAMYFGCPVVCSDIPVFREVGGDVPTYADTTDAVALACALSAVLEGDDSEGTLRAAKARRQARSFSWTATADTFCAGIRALVEVGAPPSEMVWSPE